MPTILSLFQNTAVQFVLFFGAFILGGILLSFPSRWMNNVFHQFALPRAGLFVFGAIGIPVHELSHAFFCKLFGHEIKAIKLFDPRAKGGAHGSVTHHYDPWNPYHRVGHFFIGLGPAIFGPLLLSALLYLLVPNTRAAFAHLLSAPSTGLVSSLHLFSRAFAEAATWTSPGLYVFLYLAVSISSQIELSREDIKQSFEGVFPILLVLFGANVFAWSLDLAWPARAQMIGTRVFSLVACAFALAAILSITCLALVTLVMDLLNRLIGRAGVNPFRH